MKFTSALLLFLGVFATLSAVLAASDSNSTNIADATVVICAIVRDEERYIDEWLRYNKYLGFEHVYLYDNSDIPSQYLLSLNMVYEDFVTVTHRPGQKAQEPAYNDFLGKHKNENMWVAIIDADEFIALRQHNTIQDFLRDVAPNGGALTLNWRRFSNGGVKKRAPGPVVSRFTYTTEEVSHFVKTISYVRDVEMLQIHNSNTMDGKPHVDVKGRTQNQRGFDYSDNKEGNRDIAYIAHYHTKSLEEYVIKRQRGRVDLDNRGGYVSYIRIANEFERYNTPYCEIEDTFVRDFYLRHYFGSAYKLGNTGGDGLAAEARRPPAKDNTPIQCDLEKQLYLYVNGTSRPFKSWNAFVSRGFDLDNVVRIPRWQCNRMPVGASLD